MYKDSECGILVDECLSHNVLLFSLNEQLKVHFKIFLQHEGCLLKHFVLYELFVADEHSVVDLDQFIRFAKTCQVFSQKFFIEYVL